MGYSPWGRKRVGNELATKQQLALRLVNGEYMAFSTTHSPHLATLEKASPGHSLTLLITLK